MLEKWSINRLAEESGMDRRTVKKRLEKVEPCDFQDGDSPLYHLRSFIDALLAVEQSGGGLQDKLLEERIRNEHLEGEDREIDLALKRKEVVPVDVAFQTVSNMLFSVRRVIETSGLANEEKDEIYEQLTGLSPEDFVNEAKFEEGEDK